MNETGKQFSFTRAASSTSGRAKSKFLSVTFAITTVCLGTRTSVAADDSPIAITLQNGYLSWTNVNPSLYYSVEYLPNLTQAAQWTNSYKSLQDIHSDTGIISVPIGMFFRVVARTNPLYIKTLSSTSDIVQEGYYETTTLTAVDTNLTSTNIRAGVAIFGHQGTSNVVDTSSGTATPNRILNGDKAWVAGREVTGTIQYRGLGNSPLMEEGFYQLTFLPGISYGLVSENIKKGVSIFGVMGTYDGTTPPGDYQTVYWGSFTNNVVDVTNLVHSINDVLLNATLVESVVRASVPDRVVAKIGHKFIAVPTIWGMPTVVRFNGFVVTGSPVTTANGYYVILSQNYLYNQDTTIGVAY